jgi:hypothetical protein
MDLLFRGQQRIVPRDRDCVQMQCRLNLIIDARQVTFLVPLRLPVNGVWVHRNEVSSRHAHGLDVQFGQGRSVCCDAVVRPCCDAGISYKSSRVQGSGNAVHQRMRGGSVREAKVVALSVAGDWLFLQDLGDDEGI